jgi:membrane protein
MQRGGLILFVVFIAIRIVVAAVIIFIVQPDTGIQGSVFVAVVRAVVIFVVAAFIVEVVVTGAIRSGFITGRIVVFLIVPGIDDVFIAGTEDLCIFGILTFCIDGLSVFGIIAFGADGRCRVIQALAGRVTVHAVVGGAAGTACITGPRGLFLRHLRCFMFQAALQIVTGLVFLLLVFHDLLCIARSGGQPESWLQPLFLFSRERVMDACVSALRSSGATRTSFITCEKHRAALKTPCGPACPPLRTLQRVCSPLLHTPSAPGVPRVAGCSPHPNGTATGTNARQRPRELGRTV